MENFKKKNLEEFSRFSQLFLNLLHDLDALLATHEDFLLGKFLESAKILGNSSKEQKEQFEFNARNQITLWGPSGQIVDYATKQWSGIVRDYYYPRWEMFLGKLEECLVKKIPFNQGQFQKEVFERVELPFNLDKKEYKVVSEGE